MQAESEYVPTITYEYAEGTNLAAVADTAVAGTAANLAAVAFWTVFIAASWINGENFDTAADTPLTSKIATTNNDKSDRDIFLFFF